MTEKRQGIISSAVFEYYEITHESMWEKIIN